MNYLLNYEEDDTIVFFQKTTMYKYAGTAVQSQTLTSLSQASIGACP
jgi:hypothetical protein